MRIGLVVPGFSAAADDWCIPALRHLTRDLAASDEVRVIAVRYPYRATRYAIDGAQVITLGGGARRGLTTLELWRDTLRLVQAEHRRVPFDVLHAFWATESGLLAGLAGRILHVPTLVSLAGGELAALRGIAYGDQRVAWERLKVQVSLRLATAVSGGSHWLLQLAQQRVPRAKLHRAPLGVPLQLFRPRSAQRPAERTLPGPKLLHVGSLTAVKDQATLLRAFAQLRALWPKATLDVVGDGRLRDPLGRLAEALDVAPAVRWRGEVNHAALPDSYRAADIFVLSSRHEAQGMVALEAAACGLPVVGTHVGVIPEITPATLVASVGDTDALAGALNRACAEAPGAASFAHDRVAADFSLSVCTARFRQLYAGVVQPWPQGR